VVAHLWELRADPAPLEAGARQWARVSAALTTTADDIVDAARQALDQGWESEAAEGYEAHRRQMVQHLDTFTTVAARIGGSLAALAAMLRTAQQELDRAWGTVATVPHELVGDEQVPVFHPASDADDALVRATTATARAVRDRLDLQLDGESARLREARMELATARSGLVRAGGGAWPAGANLSGRADDGASHVDDGTWSEPPAGPSPTSVLGGATGGGSGAGSAPIGAGRVFAPVLSELSGLSASALAVGAAAGGPAARRSRRRQQPAADTDVAPVGGMAAGAAVRGGSAARPGGSDPRSASPGRVALRAAQQVPAAKRTARRAEREGDLDGGRARTEVSEVAPGEGHTAQR
jgi:hypothetical protein